MFSTLTRPKRFIFEVSHAYFLNELNENDDANLAIKMSVINYFSDNFTLVNIICIRRILSLVMYIENSS